jgi:integrase
LSEGTLLVRESKFHKSRLLPLSRDALHAIEMLLRERRAKRLPLAPESSLLWSGYGSGMYSGVGFAENIQGLLRKCGIRTAAGRLPRVHDFRHHADSWIMPTHWGHTSYFGSFHVIAPFRIGIIRESLGKPAGGRRDDIDLAGHRAAS